MTHAAAPYNTASAARSGNLLSRVADAIARRRVFNKTYAELSALSTRELDDLGISRSMISRMAHEAAYGK